MGIGAPAHEVGHPVTFEPVVVEGDDVFVVLTGITAYGNGVDGLLRLGVTYPDGHSAWTSDELAAPAGGDEEGGDVELSTTMGTGDQRSWDQEIWLSPVPEPGDEPLELVLDWPARGIAEQVLDLDVTAREIAEAAERTIELWPSG